MRSLQSVIEKNTIRTSKGMNVVIVEDDDLMADLLKTVMAGLRLDIQLFQASTLEEARDLWRQSAPGLFVLDWTLPDGSGLSLLKEIRSVDKTLPIVIVSARSDRDSILRAARFGISAYISKPFSIEVLQRRLLAVLHQVLPGEDNSKTLSDRLLEGLESGIQIPTQMDISGILSLLGRVNDLSAAQLAESWQKEAPLCARLLEVANRSSFRRSGKPVATVQDAISTMGVPMALSQALGLALDVGSVFQCRPIRRSAEYYQGLAEAVGSSAQKIAVAVNKKNHTFQTAGLLSRLGELAVLHIMEQFVRQGGELSNADIEQGLKLYAQQYGNKLKVQWRLPLEIRQMIGAVHLLTRESVKQELLIMRAAGLLAESEVDTPECARILRQLGLEEWQEKRNKASSSNENE